jgi:hypothetical protein
VNLYGFLRNWSVNRVDRLGNSPSWALTGPQDWWIHNTQPEGPGIGDHINNDPNVTSAKADFERWLQENYSKSIAQGKNSIKADIESEIKKLCFNKGDTVTKQSFSVGPKTQKGNGEYPGYFEYMLTIGKFSMYSRNVNIKWDKSNCSYTWSGEVYAEEVTGATKGQDLFNDVAHATGFFYERKVEYASWQESGSGTCKK